MGKRFRPPPKVSHRFWGCPTASQFKKAGRHAIEAGIEAPCEYRLEGPCEDSPNTWNLSMYCPVVTKMRGDAQWFPNVGSDIKIVFNISRRLPYYAPGTVLTLNVEGVFERKNGSSGFLLVNAENEETQAAMNSVYDFLRDCPVAAYTPRRSR